VLISEPAAVRTYPKKNRVVAFVSTARFTAYILDPCCKASIIAIIMLNQHDKLLKIAKKYIIIKWPALDKV
jgi:hypothetical protein